MWCSTCGKDSATAECQSCAQWWANNAPRTDDENAALFGDDDSDGEQDDWHEMACSMGRDGQCGQAGSEWCDFKCKVMAAFRAQTQSRG